MNKVMIIGIDSLDSDLISKFQDELPNFKKLKENNPDISYQSVFPPDSDTAWASIYTGLNPAKHGIIKFVDPLEKSVDIQTKEAEAESLKGKTFWDIAGKFDKKVCVLLPHIAYPPWKVNGIMVSRSRIHESVEIIPEQFDDYPLKRLNSPKGVPRKDEKSLKKVIASYEELISNETDFFLNMVKNKDWDLFFCYSSALDAIQHYFWNYCDENNAKYSENTPFRNVIKDFYKAYDLMVGRLISSVDERTAILILSDHGHGGRPPKLININEILRLNGYINVKNKTHASGVLETLKSKSIECISRYDLGWAASKTLKIFPQFKEFYSTSHSLNLKSSTAYVTDLSGIKAYTYGGIIVRRDKLSSEDYEIVRENIIQILKKEVGDKIVWIAKREDVYDGEFLSKYPDIILQLREGYGLGNKVNAPIIDNAYTSNIVPGSHRGETPVFFIANSNKVIFNKNITLMDISPAILDLLGIEFQEIDFDGKSFFKEKYGI